MYLIIDEDGAAFTRESIDDLIIESSYNGYISILDISNPREVKALGADNNWHKILIFDI